MYHVSLAFQCLYGCSLEIGEIGMGRKGVIFQENERKWRLYCFLYANYLVLCGELGV